MSILDELRREFPGWTFTLDKHGDPKAWDGPCEPLETETSQYALIERSSSGGFNGYPLRGGSVKFPTLLEAAEYALGEKAESTKAREGDPVLAELRREFPAFTVRSKKWDGRLLQYIMWHASEPKPVAYERTSVVANAGPDGWTAMRPASAPKHGFTTPIAAAECATGTVRASYTKGTVINAEVPPEPRKDFTAKPRLTLIPAGVLARHLLPVLHDGAKKHGRDHWRKCSAREYAEAAASHLLAFLDGQDIDESGHHSLAHAMADCALALGTLDKDTTP